MHQLVTCCLLLFLFSCKSKEDDAQPTENFVLKNRKIYTDKLNIFGLPDTSYIKMYNYENLNVKDSSEMFSVSKYDDDRRLVLRSFFFIGKDGSPVLKSQSRYSYSDKYLSNIVDETSGILTKEENYVYDTSGKILKSTIVRIRNYDKVLQKEDSEIIDKDTLIKQGYDTMHVAYKYDAENKNIGAEFVDNRGSLIRRDINIYTGNSPLSSYNIGPNGDTLQRIIYVQAGNKLTSQAESNDFVIVTAMNSGYLTGKITFDKKKNEKLRQEWSYEAGRLVEEKFYVDSKKN